MHRCQRHAPKEQEEVSELTKLNYNLTFSQYTILMEYEIFICKTISVESQGPGIFSSVLTVML